VTNPTRRSIVRQKSPSIAVMGALDENGNPVRPRRRTIETDWNTRNLGPSDRLRRRHDANKVIRKAQQATARGIALEANRQRIADLKAKGLALPGQSAEQANAIRATQRR
jgi:hypothetical protein